MRRITIHLKDQPGSVTHGYPDEVSVRDNVLCVWMDGGDRAFKYPLTSVISWEVDK